MTRSVHRLAESDFADAFRYYKSEAGAGVAGRFLMEFERVARLLESNPGFGTPTNAGRRWFPLRGYPYSVIYRETDTGIRILVVRHQSRDPPEVECPVCETNRLRRIENRFDAPIPGAAAVCPQRRDDRRSHRHQSAASPPHRRPRLPVAHGNVQAHR